MPPTIRLVLMTALRDRLFQSLFVLFAAVLGVAVFLGGAVIVEARETAAVYAASAARIVVVLGLIVFVAFHIEKLIETREIEAILSREISRGGFLAAYWFGMALVAVLLLIPVGIVVAALSTSMWGALMWAASVALESLVVVAFVMFCGLTFARSVPTIFAAAGFYALTRSLGFVLGIVMSQYRQRTGINSVLNPYMDFLTLALPRLDLFGQSNWLIYGPPPLEAAMTLSAQALVYVVILLLAAGYDLNRKQF